MNATTILGITFQGATVLGFALMGLGLWLMERGLWGGTDGRRGLLRGHEPALRRAEGWRVLVAGFVTGMLGLAALLSSPTLFYMAIGIGIVELWEATFVISAWRAGDARKAPEPRL